MPYHVALDRANEARLDGAKVGTTGRGIGPTYGDRAWRLGLRMEDLLDRAVLRERIERAAARQEPPARSMGARAVRAGARWSPRRCAWGERLRDHLDDTTWLVQAALARGEHVLLEGAQGTLLDLDHGSYPFVTSSNPVAGGACTGGGIGPLQVDEVIGVMKAYSTRVGSGPFPTELHDEIGAGIAERGHEFGTVTGRPRRVGWFDAVPAPLRGRGQQRQLIMLNKLDILSGHRPDPAVRRLRDRRAAGRALAVERRARSLARPRSTRSSRAGPSRSTPSARSPTCPRTPGATSARSRHTPASRSCCVSVGPERTQTIERAWRPMRHRTGLPA